jgi:hypothetical protein
MLYDELGRGILADASATCLASAAHNQWNRYGRKRAPFLGWVTRASRRMRPPHRHHLLVAQGATWSAAVMHLRSARGFLLCSEPSAPALLGTSWAFASRRVAGEVQHWGLVAAADRPPEGAQIPSPLVYVHKTCKLYIQI